ncbi:MAG: acyl-CoA dehydratase activase [Solirubrobacterales bacterium]
MTAPVYLGIDVGSVTTKAVALDAAGSVRHSIYLRTRGNPVQAVQQAARILGERIDPVSVAGVGTTGSGRNLAAVIVGADAVRNEITAHAVGALRSVPDARTILEIGGQDSKLILLRDGVVVDFAMNTVCAAGTGSFLDQQAMRLGIPIEAFGELAVSSSKPARIAGRCGVFAESDMIHKQQAGYPVEDILAGLCQALARNFLNNLAHGKRLEAPVVFQGGVAANPGMRQAFEAELGQPVYVPEHHAVMGALGAALLGRQSGSQSKFKGFAYVCDGSFASVSRLCDGCPNQCEVVSIERDGISLAFWGDRCRKWERSAGQTASILEPA